MKRVDKIVNVSATCVLPDLLLPQCEVQSGDVRQGPHHAAGKALLLFRMSFMAPRTPNNKLCLCLFHWITKIIEFLAQSMTIYDN